MTVALFLIVCKFEISAVVSMAYLPKVEVYQTSTSVHDVLSPLTQTLVQKIKKYRIVTEEITWKNKVCSAVVEHLGMLTYTLEPGS